MQRAKWREHNEEIKRLKSDEHPDICPRCGQGWPNKGAGKDHLEAELVRLKAQLDRVTKEVAPGAARADTLAAQLEEQRRIRRRALSDREILDQSVDTRAERALLTAALAAEANLTSAQKVVCDLREKIPEDGSIDVDTSDLDSQLDKLRKEAHDIRDELVDLVTLKKRLEFWKRGFGRGGLPSMLLDSSIPSMNQTASAVASLLSNGELSVSFDPAAAKGKGDVFAVNVEYADGGDDYESSSNGEHTRVDLAVLFALRDLVERRGANRCTQLFLDECFQGTDPAFAEAIVTMLRTQYAHKTVFIVSHDDAIKAQCDKTIVVRKTGHVSRIDRTD